VEFEHFFPKFIKKLQEVPFVSGTISQPRRRSSELRRVRMRLVELQGELHIQFEYQYEERFQHNNVKLEHIDQELWNLLKDFRQVHVQFQQSDDHIQISKRFKVRWQVTELEEEREVSFTHNRKKEYLLTEGKAYPFLVRLGVQTEDGKVRQRHYDKFKQINRFVELIDDAIEYLPKDKEIRILDFGSGKSYLTFALYHYLHIEKGLDIRVTGLDLKKDVIEMCSNIAQDLRYENLDFKVGDINDYEEDSSVDMVVTLHACDVATDMALAKAVEWQAKVILSVPCCQHELRSQIEAPELDIMLKHGFMKEQFSAIATDSLRAELLNIVGYETQLVEFISMEHTPKNTLIRAYYTGNKLSKEEARAYEEFRDLLQAKPFLENELKEKLPFSS